MTDIDWGRVRDFLEAGTIVWGIAASFIVLYLRGQFVTRKTYDQEIKRLDLAIAHCRATSGVETEALKLAVEKLNGILGRIEERGLGERRGYDRLTIQMDRIENYLLDQKVGT